MANKKVQVQLLDEQTGVVIEDVDVLTTAECVRFTDGKTFQDKLNDGSLRGPAGATGQQGPKGEPGQQGATGARGVDGSKMHNVTGAPATSLGAVGDWALNTSNADVYEKTASTTWTKRGNFKGAQGPKGDTGAKGETGAQGIQGLKGDKGDPGDSIKVGTSTTNAVSRKLFFKVIG